MPRDEVNDLEQVINNVRLVIEMLAEVSNSSNFALINPSSVGSTNLLNPIGANAAVFVHATAAGNPVATNASGNVKWQRARP